MDIKSTCKNLIAQFKKISIHSVLGTIGILILITAVSIPLFGFVMTKNVTIYDGDCEIKVTTGRSYVEELLAEQGITLRDGDKISEALDASLKNNSEIVIERAKKIVLTADGTTRDIYSCEPILSAALRDCGVELGEFDEIEPNLETPVTDEMNVQIFRVRVTEENTTEVIPRGVVTKVNPDKRAGHQAVISEGRDGSASVTYRVVTRDGQEAARDEIARSVVEEAVDKVIEKGVQGSKVVAASNAELNVKRVIDCKATAYSASVACNGSFAGKTASGRTPAYGIVAVDPKVIPLGTKLYIEAVDGSWVYGYAIAGDTGGAIRGNKVDLFYNTMSECYSFGRRQARVYVLE